MNKVPGHEFCTVFAVDVTLKQDFVLYKMFGYFCCYILIECFTDLFCYLCTLYIFFRDRNIEVDFE